MPRRALGGRGTPGGGSWQDRKGPSRAGPRWEHPCPAGCGRAVVSSGGALESWDTVLPRSPESKACAPQETSDKSVIELQQYAKKNKPNLHILSKLQEEMKRLAEEREETRKKPKMSIVASAQPGGEPLCTVDV